MNGTTSNEKASAHLKKPSTIQKDKQPNGGRYLHMIPTIWDECPKYIKNAYNSTTKTVQLKIGQRAGTDTIIKTYRWQTYI